MGYTPQEGSMGTPLKAVRRTLGTRGWHAFEGCAPWVHPPEGATEGPIQGDTPWEGSWEHL